MAIQNTAILAILGVVAVGGFAAAYIAKKKSSQEKVSVDEPKVEYNQASSASEIRLPANAQFGITCVSGGSSVVEFHTKPDGSVFDSDIQICISPSEVKATQYSGGQSIDMGQSASGGIQAGVPFHIQVDYGELIITQNGRTVLNALPTQLRSNFQAGPYTLGTITGGRFLI